MTAFGKLIRTTAFRLTLFYLFLFAVFAASLLGYFAWNTRRMITEEITQTVNAETSELNEIYGRRGLFGLVRAIEYRALRPNANLYLVTNPSGQSVAGNVGALAPGVMATRGWSETAYRRIEALMVGLKEVSDNIAHDLKTPLTRLRNRAEEALAKSASEAEYRAALERTIEESDGLIRTFNALLMIARAESGQARGNMNDFDAAEVANGIHELYEPLAEDDGMSLKVKTQAAPVHGNRELISQALANLVDNAIKYGAPGGAGGAAEIVLKACDRGDRVVLSVADSGPGIAEADRARAMERFVRLEQSRSKPGSGLGLSLAAAIARLHGGELTLEGNHPGLVSVISLPRVAAPPPEKA